MSRVLLKGLTIVTMNKNNEVIEDGSIAIENGVIQFVCETDAQTQDWQADETYEFTGKIAVPGFINAHTHAAMTLLRGYADDMALMEWLSDKIWPFESHLTPEDVYYGTLLACAEMIRSGTTTFADIFPYGCRRGSNKDFRTESALIKGPCPYSTRRRERYCRCRTFLHPMARRRRRTDYDLPRTARSIHMPARVSRQNRLRSEVARFHDSYSLE